MQRSSEFPLFCQTAIAIFGFLFFIAIVSTVSAPKTNLNGAIAPTIEVAQQ